MSDAQRTTGVSRRRVLGGAAALGLGIAGSAMLPGSAEATPGANGGLIQLTHQRHTQYRILVGADEDAVTKQAAGELADYLHQITGVSFDVGPDDTPPRDDHVLVIGRKNARAAAICNTVNYDDLGDDGFALRVHGVAVLIAGPNSRGTLYGVYWLLDHILGVRWYAPGATHVPSSPDLTVRADLLNADHVPHLRYRNILFAGAKDPAYRQHNMLNGLRDFYWTQPTPAGVDTWDHYWPEEVHGTFYQVVPNAAFHHGGQLLFMDPGTREAAATSLIARIKQRIAEGQDASTAFYQNDAPWTPDPASRAFADAHGGALSAPMIDMVNDVIHRVRQEIPNARLETQAYNWSLTPPTGLKLDDNVVLTIAPNIANWGQSLFAEGNAEVGRDIKAWSTQADNIVLWSYLANFSPTGFIVPFPDWYAEADTLKGMDSLGQVQGYFANHITKTPVVPFAYLQIWMISRLLWDPTLDADLLIQDFLHGYLGPAAPMVHEYMQSLVDSVKAHDSTVTSRAGSPLLPATYLDFDTIRRADSLMEQAAAAVSGDVTLTGRVDTIRLGVDFVILVLREQYERVAQQRGISWTANTEQRLQRFEAELAASGMTSEAPGAAETVLAKAKTPLPPPVTGRAVKTTASKDTILVTFDFSTGPWSTAGVLDDFFVMNTGDAPTVKTQAHLLWDDSFLYVGYQNFDPGLPNIPIQTYVGNSVQTFIQTLDGGINGFFTNPAGAQYSYRQDPGARPLPITASWEGTVHVGTDSWSVIQAIPFALLGIDPTATSKLKALFFRNYNHQKVFIGWGGGAPWKTTGLSDVDLALE